jgi:hypothetical protein
MSLPKEVAAPQAKLTRWPRGKHRPQAVLLLVNRFAIEVA